MPKEKEVRAAWFYQTGFYLLLVAAVAAGVTKHCLGLQMPEWYMWAAEVVYIGFAGMTPKAVRACSEEGRVAAEAFSFIGFTILIAFVVWCVRM